ncbi:hypothetical protein ACMDCT_02920 [Halomonadaceae bacterium KBTZ08]
MRFKYVVVGLALAVAGFLTLALSRGWFLFDCGWVGCIGVWILYLEMGALVVFVFFISGLVLGPAPRFLSGLFAGGSALVALILAVGVLIVHAQWQISQDKKGAEQACAQYPELCSEKAGP